MPRLTFYAAGLADVSKLGSPSKLIHHLLHPPAITVLPPERHRQLRRPSPLLPTSTLSMADLRALFTSTISTTAAVLITNPFSIGLSFFTFAFKTAFLVINTWSELISASISLYLRLFRSSLICIIALASLPFRVLTALSNQRMLEDQLAEMQAELETLSWERKVLEDHFRAAVKECKSLDSLLAEAEDETEKLITKLELLETELRALKVENHRLKVPPHGRIEPRNHHAAGVSDGGDSNDEGVVMVEQRDMAVSQSVLSAVLLSLTVGMIVCEGKEVVMPLVVALYAVVGMSMRNAVKFFATIKNKPAADAVALLGFNCFVLGTLTFPTLPRVLRILGSLASGYLNRLVRSWLRLS